MENLVVIYITVVRYDLDTALADPYPAGRIVGNVVFAVTGGYLALNGRWVIERIFLPSSEENNSLQVSSATADPEEDEV